MDRFHREPLFDTRTSRACAFCLRVDPEFNQRNPLDQLVKDSDKAGGHITEGGYLQHRIVELRIHRLKADLFFGKAAKVRAIRFRRFLRKYAHAKPVTSTRNDLKGWGAATERWCLLRESRFLTAPSRVVGQLMGETSLPFMLSTIFRLLVSLLSIHERFWIFF